MPWFARRSAARRAKVHSSRLIQFESLEGRSLLAGLQYDIGPIAPLDFSDRVPAVVAKSAPQRLSAAAVLADDALEENDYWSAARNLGTMTATSTFSGLVMADSHDWYRFYLPATGTVEDAVAINFLNAQGDLDLRLFNSSGYRLRSSATTGDGERISLSGLAAGTYYLDVYGYYGAKNPGYSLAVSRKAPLVDDTLEQNDSFSAARDLGSLAAEKTVTNLVMADSSDWYKFTMAAPGTSTDFVQIGFHSAQGNLQLALYNAAGSYLAGSASTTDVERISLADKGAGTYYVRVYGQAGATNPNYTLQIDPGVAVAPPATAPTPVPAPAPTGAYNIEFVFSGLTATQQAFFEQAAAKWESVIVGDLPDASYYGRMVDDLLIEASAAAIDGVGGILGQAGPDYIRGGSLLPIHGVMEFDSADMNDMIADGTFLGVILHEMGHVLGVGTLWQDLGLVTGAGTANPQYVGMQGLAAYNAIFGTSAGGVPVEAGGGEGTRDSHWRESVFSTELMTGWVGPGSNMPLSRISVGSLADIGYTVNLAAADPYTPPASLLASNTGSATSGSASASLRTTASWEGHRSARGRRELDQPLESRREWSKFVGKTQPTSKREFEVAVDELFSRPLTALLA